MSTLQIIFTVEIGIKLLGNGTYALKDFWGKFDFSITAIAWVVQYLVIKHDFEYPELVFSIRFAKAVTLFRRVEGLSIILNIVYLSVPELLNIGFFVGIVMYCYAAIGV